MRKSDLFQNCILGCVLGVGCCFGGISAERICSADLDGGAELIVGNVPESCVQQMWRISCSPITLASSSSRALQCCSNMCISRDGGILGDVTARCYVRHTKMNVEVKDYLEEELTESHNVSRQQCRVAWACECYLKVT